MAITNYGDVARAYDEGRCHSAMFRRTNPAFGASYTVDMSYAPGVPVANFYASTPLVTAALDGKDGIYTGPTPPAGMKKYLHKIMIMSGASIESTASFTLLDYLVYAPFIDYGTTDVQTFTPLELPRYTDGRGVRAMLVSQGAGASSTPFAFLNYVDDKGDTYDMVADGSRIYTSVDAGKLNSGAYDSSGTNLFVGAFLRQVKGTTGLRAVNSLRLEVVTGDGIGALVLVKPLASITQAERNAATEVDFLADRGSMPEILPGAFLNFIARPGNSVAPVIVAQLDFIWG